MVTGLTPLYWTCAAFLLVRGDLVIQNLWLILLTCRCLGWTRDGGWAVPKRVQKKIMYLWAPHCQTTFIKPKIISKPALHDQSNMETLVLCPATWTNSCLAGWAGSHLLNGILVRAGIIELVCFLCLSFFKMHFVLGANQDIWHFHAFAIYSQRPAVGRDSPAYYWRETLKNHSGWRGGKQVGCAGSQDVLAIRAQRTSGNQGFMFCTHSM